MSSSLSTFSSELGCQVLNPDAFKPEVINAFHPDYIKTYHPELMKQIKSEAMYKKKGEELSKHVDRIRETKPSHGTMFGITEKSVSIAPLKRMKRTPHEKEELSTAVLARKPKAKRREAPRQA